MNQFTIVSLPKVNLELPDHKFQLKSFKLLTPFSPPCHFNLKTIERQKICKQSKDMFIKYRKKKKHITLKDYLNKNRSYSTKQIRKAEQSRRLSNTQKNSDPIVLCQVLSNPVQAVKQMKIKKQIISDHSIKMQKVNLYDKLSKKNLALQQHIRRLHRYHQITSLPVFISMPKKISYSITPRNLQYNEVLKRRFLSLKNSLGSRDELGKGQKYFQTTLKDYKIEGWNMKQSRNGFRIQSNS